MSRRRVASPAALVLLALALLPTATARADPDREVVVALAPGHAALPVARLSRLGLRPLGTLAALSGGGARPLVSAGPAALDPDRVWLLEAPDPAAAATALDSLRTEAAVEWAEPNRTREPAVVAADPLLPDDPLLRDGRQWGLRNPGPTGPAGGVAGADVGALGAWSRCSGANDLLLAVADTGIDPAQPDLGGAMPDGSPRLVLAANVTGVEPCGAVTDSFGHGTPVAGVMAARTNDGPHRDSLGAAGVCGGDGAGNAGCRIVPIKIAAGRSGSATSFAVAAAIAHATAAGARAMNLSFAGDAPSRVERLALQQAITHGCVVVAAAGNHGYSASRARMYPASFAADGLCIQVGASDASDQRAVWSGYGPDMDLVAPGLGIWTTFMTYPSAAGVSYPGYAAFSGTSFAAPFVTGAVGLLVAARPELDDVDLRHVLRESAHDIGEPGVDSTTGWGRLDAAAALAAVGPDIGVWHDETAATVFRALDRETLAVQEGGFGSLGRWLGRHPAERIEATAVVALPDSFPGPVRVWPRVAGTTTVRGDWALPWYAPHAEVAEWLRPGTALPAGTRAFTLRGWLYRVLDAGGDVPEDEYVPLPPEQARFGFTVLGPVARRLSVTAPGRETPLRVAPNPFRTTARIAGPAAARVDIFDLAGRRRRVAVLGDDGGFAWDGHDDDGRRVAPGLYFLRVRGAAGTARLVRIE
jgi:subtilisin family serine protease